MNNYAIFIIILYLSSAGSTILRLFLDSNYRPPSYLGLGLGFCGATLQIILLYNTIITSSGINLSFFNALALAAWSVIITLLLSSITKPVENLGIIVFPTGAITVLLERQLPKIHLIAQSASWQLKFHIVVSLIAYSILTLASVQAILLAIQDHHLHHHHPGGFIRALPPLQTMEKLLFEMIGAGFILLTLSLISGFVFLDNMFTQNLVHKTILSVCGWILFGILLLGRFRAGWRGRAAITWTISGFVILMLAYFGSKAVLELVLKNN
jgi:ABC-type uncharacterized transport system permease subunit